MAYSLDLASDRCIIPLDWRYLHVILDVTEFCNLTCIHCPFVHMRDQMEHHASLGPELLGKLEREVFPYTARVSLSSFHEP